MKKKIQTLCKHVKSGDIPALKELYEFRVKMFRVMIDNYLNHGFSTFFQIFLKIFILIKKESLLIALSKVLVNSSRQKSTNEKRLLIFVMAWGDKYLEYLNECCLRSLLQSGNIPELVKKGYKIKFSVHTTDEDRRKIDDILLHSINKAGLHALVTSEVKSYRSPKGLKEKALLSIIEESIEEHSMVLNATADMFYGNHSIDNMVSANMDRGLCLAGPMFRINADEFRFHLKNDNDEINNRQLANYMFKFLNTDLEYSDISKLNTSKATGISTQRINTETVLLTSRLPTVHIANFCEGDLRYFKRRPFEDWDHRWPSKLMAEGRYKMIGSSDTFLCVEVTDHCENNNEISDIGNDDYHADDSFHKTINRSFLISIKI